MEKLLRNHTAKMYAAAVAAEEGHPMLDESRYLPEIEKLPKEVLAEVIKEGRLPYLTPEQMSAVKVALNRMYKVTFYQKVLYFATWVSF